GIRDFHVTGVQTCALPIYYGGMKADELRVEAERRNLSTSGTKAELIARLEKSDRMVAEEPADAGMFPVEQEVQGVSDPEPSEGRSEERRVGEESMGRWKAA